MSSYICDLYAQYLIYNPPLALAIPLCCKSLIINDELILVSTMPKKDIPKSLAINTVADVTTLLRFLLRIKSLSPNNVADVAGFKRTYTFCHFPFFLPAWTRWRRKIGFQVLAGN